MTRALEAPIFDVQSLATRDGPGIRTLVFFCGCPLACSWCANPEGQRVEGARRITAEALLGRLERDLRFYWNSGGGVTFSGGEPLLYPEFVEEVARGLRALGADSAVETCGEWDWDTVEGALQACQTIFFDLKALDSALHTRFTGRSCERIQANLVKAAERYPERLVVSVPLIPSVVDSLEEGMRVAGWLSRNGVRRARLLPYHGLGKGKYVELGLAYPHEPFEHPLPAGLPRALQAVMDATGITTEIG